MAQTDLVNGPLPTPLYDEAFFIAPPYSSPGVFNTVGQTLGQIRRAGHTFDTGYYGQQFDVQNGVCMPSPLGHFALC